MQTASEVAEATPNISYDPSADMTAEDLPDDPAALFNAITVLQQTVEGQSLQKMQLWLWLIETASPRVHEIQQLLFGEISPAQFCVLYPEHPACQAGEEPLP